MNGKCSAGWPAARRAQAVRLLMGAGIPENPPRVSQGGGSNMQSPGSLHDLERAAILEALQRAHGHMSRAAGLLGFTRFQLYTRLKRYGIEVVSD